MVILEKKIKHNIYFKREETGNERIYVRNNSDILSYLSNFSYKAKYNNLLSLQNLLLSVTNSRDKNTPESLIGFYKNKIYKIEEIIKNSIDSTIIYTKFTDKVKTNLNKTINREIDLFITNINIKYVSILYVFEFTSHILASKKHVSLVKKMIIVSDKGKELINSKSIYNEKYDINTIIDDISNGILQIMRNIHEIYEDDIIITKEDFLKLTEFFINVALLINKKLNTSDEKLSYSEQLIMTSRNDILFVVIPA